MKKPILFLDLDGTIMFHRKDICSDLGVKTLSQIDDFNKKYIRTWCSSNSEDEDSYMSRVIFERFNELLASGKVEIVVVTARSKLSVDECILPNFSKYLVDNGCEYYKDGELQEECHLQYRESAKRDIERVYNELAVLGTQGLEIGFHGYGIWFGKKHYDISEVNACNQILKAMQIVNSNLLVLDEGSYINIVHNEYTKGLAVHRFLDNAEETFGPVIASGDSKNDCSMIPYAEYFFIPNMCRYSDNIHYLSRIFSCKLLREKKYDLIDCPQAIFDFIENL